MSVNHDRSPVLSTAAESDIVGYSSISPAAIVALLLGLLSFFAVGNLLLLILPALAMIAAIMALSSIARSDGSISGRWAAVAGLALALLFASTAIVKATTRAWHVRTEGQKFADRWVELIKSGNVHQAHQWHLPPERRQNAGTSLAQFYHDSKPAQEEFNQFLQAAPLSSVVAAPREAKVHFVRVVEQLSVDNSDRVAVLYALDPVDGKGAPIQFVVVTERTTSENSPGGHWQVAAIAEPKDESAIP